MAEDLPFQNATLPYVMIGSIVPRYICLRQSWLIPLVEFPSMRSASAALEALEAAIFACSWNLSWGSNHKPRYLIQLVKVTSFRVLGVFAGMQMDGLVTRFLVFVKCISSFLSWSIFSPLCASHLWVSLNTMVITFAVVSRVGPDARIAPSSTYSVVCESVALSFLTSVLSSGQSTMQVVALWCTSPIISEVKYTVRIGETHDPHGTPISMGHSLSLLPSRHMEVCRSWRNECTHCVMGSGIWYEQSVLRRCECGIVSKKPVMLNVRMEALCLWFQAISMSCTVHSSASLADLPGIPPNCEDGNKSCLAVI